MTRETELMKMMKRMVTIPHCPGILDLLGLLADGPKVAKPVPSGGPVGQAAAVLLGGQRCDLDLGGGELGGEPDGDEAARRVADIDEAQMVRVQRVREVVRGRLLLGLKAEDTGFKGRQHGRRERRVLRRRSRGQKIFFSDEDGHLQEQGSGGWVS